MVEFVIIYIAQYLCKRRLASMLSSHRVKF